MAQFDLTEAILSLKTRAEVDAFLADLCTPSEVKAFQERWLVAQLMDQGELSYRDIAKKADSSTATVVRIARFLNDMPYKGYRRVIDRLQGARR
jgi:TrpR-related protein YerC/YecD